MTVREQNEKKKEYLNGYRKKTRKIESLEEQKKSILADMRNAKAIEYSDMPKGAGKQSDLSDYVVKLEGLIERIEETKDQKNQMRIAIEEIIIGMENGIECDILRKRYIEMKEWDIIANELNYSKMQVYRIHGKALVNFYYSADDVS